METKRTKEIKIRLSLDEYDKLMAMKTEPRLASWIRNQVLADPSQQKKIKVVKAVDQKLLYELNKIGTNLNQIARNVNSFSKSEWQRTHSASLLLLLADIENQLNRILENAS